MNKPYFSIIVPVKNEERLIKACLHSLKHQDTSLPYEILLVDGHSTDKTLRIAKKFPVKIIQDAKPGKCHGLQTAVYHTKGTILCFTEADCIVPKNWLSTIYEQMQGASKPAAITGMYTFHHSILPYNALATLLMPPIMHIGRILVGVYPLRTTNFAIKKSAMIAVGGFDTNTTELYDLDLSLRMHPRYAVRFVPTLLVKTSDRRFRGRTLSYLREVVTTLWFVGILRQPVSKPIYETIR